MKHLGTRTDNKDVVSQEQLADYQPLATAINTGNIHEQTVALAENLTGKQLEQSAEFYYRRSAGDADIETGTAELQAIKGKTLVWNQLAGDFTLGTKSGITLSALQDGRYKISGTATSTISFNSRKTIPVLSGHKYFVTAHSSLDESGSTAQTVLAVRDGAAFSERYSLGEGRVINCTASGSATLYYFVYTNFSIDEILSFQFFDLTQMFGAGNEPTTVAEFEALFPESYYEYNTGELMSYKGQSIKTTELNQWDEIAVPGSIDDSGVITRGGSSSMISDHPIRVVGGASYYFYSHNGQRVDACWYDSSMSFISKTKHANTRSSLIAPAGSTYLYLRLFGATSYNYDICVHFPYADTTRNNVYEAYEEHTLPLNITQITSNGVAVFPDGMKSAGAVYDELTGLVNGAFTKAVKRIGVEGLETYELAEPIEYTLDTPVPADYYVHDMGTEQSIPEAPLSAPLVADIHYGLNASDTIKRLPVTLAYIKDKAEKALPKSGGTMTGSLIMQNDSNTPYIMFKRGTANGAYLYYLGGTRWNITNEGWSNAYNLYHSGNLTAATLGAETTVHAAATYLPLSGGTLTGALTLDYENTWGGHDGRIKWKNNRQSASGGGRNDEFFSLLKADGTYNASFGVRGSNDVDTYLYIGYGETNAFRIYPNGNVEVTGNIIRNTTGQSIGTSAAPWGEIHANKWYPNANDTTNYIEYTGSGFLIHGNVAATGEVAAGQAN